MKSTETKTAKVTLKKNGKKIGGITCPQCGCSKTHVTDSRGAMYAGHGGRYRMRKCGECPTRWSTIEVQEIALFDLEASAKKMAAITLLSASGMTLSEIISAWEAAT